MSAEQGEARSLQVRGAELATRCVESLRYEVERIGTGSVGRRGLGRLYGAIRENRRVLRILDQTIEDLPFPDTDFVVATFRLRQAIADAVSVATMSRSRVASLLMGRFEAIEAKYGAAPTVRGNVWHGRYISVSLASRDWWWHTCAVCGRSLTSGDDKARGFDGACARQHTIEALAGFVDDAQRHDRESYRQDRQVAVG